jgi:hypothetical protein
VSSMWVLEPCKGCRGTGSPGTAGKYVIVCEVCGGSRLVWVERCYLGGYFSGDKEGR